MKLDRQPIKHKIEAIGDYLIVCSSVVIPEVPDANHLALHSVLDPDLPILREPGSSVRSCVSPTRRLMQVYRQLVAQHESTITRSLDVLEVHGVEAYRDLVALG